MAKRTIALGTLVAIAVLVVAVRHRAVVSDGAQILRGADTGWLLAAILGSAGLWLAGTVSQLGVIPVRPSLRRVFVVQIAASFANHLLPGGLGGMAVNVRFLRRLGLSRPSALSAVGLNSLATGITHAVLLGAVLLAAPGLVAASATGLRRSAGSGLPTGSLTAGSTLVVLAALVLLATTGLLVWRRRRRSTAPPARSPSRQLLRTELAQLATVLRDPRRAAQLWLGATSAGILHGLILLAVLRSLGGTTPALSVVAIYLATSALSSLIPAPGAVGPLDLMLVAGLLSLGTSSPAAVATVLGYRLVTVWLPLLPSALVFGHLLRRRQL